MSLSSDAGGEAHQSRMTESHSASPTFLFLLTFMGAAVVVKYDSWKNVSPFARDNIAMRATLFAVLIYCTVVIIHERFSAQINHHLIISGNIRFLSGTLALTSMFLILIPPFGWLLLSIWVIFLVNVTLNWHEPFYDFDMLKKRIQVVVGFWRRKLTHR